MNKISWIEKGQIGLSFFVLLVILTSAIQLTFEGYYGFYYENEKYEECLLSKKTKELSQTSVYQIFTSYTGFDTGYGFFAPNVASDFIFVFKIYDDKKKLVKAVEGLKFNSKEGGLRFRTINTMYLDKLKDKDHKDYNEKYGRYLDVMMKQITQFAKKDFPENYNIENSLYLYDYPSIESFQKGEKEKLFLLKKYNL